MKLAEIPQISARWHPGLHGVKGEYRAAIYCSNTRLMQGSCDIDAAFEESEPRANRWDYGIEVKIGREEYLAFVEVHPASSSSNLDEIVKKASWLNNLLSGHEVVDRKNKWWIATDARIVPVGSKGKQKLAQVGVRGPARRTDDIADSSSY